MTILNSQQFKYFSYYDRIKDQVTELWRPLIRKATKQVKDDTKTYGTLEVRYYTTELEIRLNDKGQVLDYLIVGRSGQEKFDRAAVDAFKGPFAGPPKELIVNGRFTLRWNFTLNVEASGLIEYKGNT